MWKFFSSFLFIFFNKIIIFTHVLNCTGFTQSLKIKTRDVSSLKYDNNYTNHKNFCIVFYSFKFYNITTYLGGKNNQEIFNIVIMLNVYKCV